MAGLMGVRWMLCWPKKMLRVENVLLGRQVMKGQVYVGSIMFGHFVNIVGILGSFFTVSVFCGEVFTTHILNAPRNPLND